MDDSPFGAYTIFVLFMTLMVIIRYYNHRNFFKNFADVGIVRKRTDLPYTYCTAADSTPNRVPPRLPPQTPNYISLTA